MDFNGDNSLLLPLATLIPFVLNFIRVELCCIACLCFMSCMDSACDLWLDLIIWFVMYDELCWLVILLSIYVYLVAC